ncbi:hypothetical protein [Marinoscillum pacificum]|uniref:hypothetical protein n=1 Tax=Marinoscillum pacificum TaxID=392723 RepID=UPI0021586C79|nr:hypothetical protein [Marinoscillum pacificum]
MENNSKHPLVAYIENWEQFNQVIDKQINNTLVKLLVVTLLTGGLFTLVFA